MIKISDHFSYSKLIRFTIPSIAMMIFTSVYSVVDGFFVSNYVGKTSFAAVNLIMPFLMIVAAVGLMFGTGGTALVAKTFGEGDNEKANALFSLFTCTAFALGVIISIFSILNIRSVAVFLGAEGELLENCVTYGRIVLLALPFFILQLFFQSFFVAAEKPRIGLVVTVGAGVTNMVLDAVLIMLLPQAYKLAGAAIATALSEVVGGAVPLFYFYRRNNSILHLGKVHFDTHAIWKACTNGSSVFMSYFSVSIVGMLYNIQLLAYAGENGVAAYGIMMYVSFVFAAGFLGYSLGTAPVIGYHYGACNQSELQSILRKSVTLIAMVTIVMVLVAQIGAVPLATIFAGYDKELMALTVTGFRIFSLSFLFMGFGVFGSAFFTALNDGVTSAIIAFFRTLVFEAGAILFLPKIFGADGIWMSVVVAECMAVILMTFFLKIKQKKFGY